MRKGDGLQRVKPFKSSTLVRPRCRRRDGVRRSTTFLASGGLIGVERKSEQETGHAVRPDVGFRVVRVSTVIESFDHRRRRRRHSHDAVDSRPVTF